MNHGSEELKIISLRIKEENSSSCETSPGWPLGLIHSQLSKSVPGIFIIGTKILGNYWKYSIINTININLKYISYVGINVSVFMFPLRLFSLLLQITASNTKNCTKNNWEENYLNT